MAENDIPTIIPYGAYSPDNVQVGGDQTDRLHNVFIRADGSLIGVPRARKIVEHPKDDKLTVLFATPAADSNFTVFGGGKHLWSWNNTEFSWDRLYEDKGDSQYRWQIVDFKKVVYAAREGVGLLYFDLPEKRFKPVPGAPRVRGVYPTTDFLVGYGVQDSPQMVCWSALQDGMQWVFGENNSGFHYIPRGGGVVCVIGGQNPYIFTLRQIFRMTRTGGDTPWAFSLVNPNIGIYDHQDVCEINNMVFFHDTQSFFRIETGVDTLVDIGRDIVNYTWPYYTSEVQDRPVGLRVLGDVVGNRVYFVFPKKGTLVWNTGTDRWSTMEYEGLDVFIGNFSIASYDLMDPQYPSICLIPFRADEFRDTYSCSLALSKEDGIYMINDRSETITAIVGSPWIAQDSITEINSLSALAEGEAANAIKYTRHDLGKKTETAFVRQNAWNQSNFRLRARSFLLYARIRSFVSFRGWVVNKKEGYTK